MLLYPTPSSVLYPALLLLLSSSSSLTSLDDSHCAGGGPFGIQIQSVRASASSPSPLESTSTSTTHDKPPQIVLERTSSSRDNDDGRTHGDTPPPPSSFQVYDFAAGLTLLYDETIVETSNITYGQEVCEGIDSCILVWARARSDVLLFFTADPKDRTPTTLSMTSDDQMAWRYDLPVGPSCSSLTDRFESTGYCVCGGFGSTVIEESETQVQDTKFGCKDLLHPRGGFTTVADYRKRAKMTETMRHQQQQQQQRHRDHSQRTPQFGLRRNIAAKLRRAQLNHHNHPLILPGARYRAKSGSSLV